MWCVLCMRLHKFEHIAKHPENTDAKNDRTEDRTICHASGSKSRDAHDVLLNSFAAKSSAAFQSRHCAKVPSSDTYDATSRNNTKAFLPILSPIIGIKLPKHNAILHPYCVTEDTHFFARPKSDVVNWIGKFLSEQNAACIFTRDAGLQHLQSTANLCQ